MPKVKEGSIQEGEIQSKNWPSMMLGQSKNEAMCVGRLTQFKELAQEEARILGEQYGEKICHTININNAVCVSYSDPKITTTLLK